MWRRGRAPRGRARRGGAWSLSSSFRWTLEGEALSTVVEHDSVGGDAHHLVLGEEVSGADRIAVTVVYHDRPIVGGIADDRREHGARRRGRRGADRPGR